MDENTPLRLDDAVRLAFPAGGMTVSGLRREIAKGNLAASLVANKHFVTLADIREMLERCRVQRSQPDFGSGREHKTGKPSGSSSTPDASTARAALKTRVQKLKLGSATTSQASTTPRNTNNVLDIRRP